MNSQKVLSVREAARQLGYTLKYVYDLLYSGRLPAQKHGQRWHIPAGAVEDRLRKRGE